eukprot:7367720-Pyramimonas_sp.AAC.1
MVFTIEICAYFGGRINMYPNRTALGRFLSYSPTFFDMLGRFRKLEVINLMDKHTTAPQGGGNNYTWDCFW